jgi:type II secretory pathway pseudopilin PulG
MRVSKFTKFVIGFFTTFLLLSLLTGSVQNAVLILLGSVICTVGIGGIIWIFVSIAVGSIVVWLINSWFGKPSTTETPQKVKSNEDIALENYVNQAKKSGLPENQIFLRLRERGWVEAQILRALGGEVKIQEATKETPTTKPDRVKVIIVVLILALIVSGIYFINARNRSQSTARQHDRQRINYISNIKYAIENYYTRNGRLPKTLSNINLGYYGSAKDPKTSQPYRYSTSTKTTYKICTTFETSSTSGVGGYDYGASNNIYYHPQGYHCFNIQIPNNLIKSSPGTINDSKTRSILAKFLPNNLFRSRCYNLSSLGSNLSKRFVSLVPWGH